MRARQRLVLREPNPLICRRKRLKDATIVRRDEFDLEEKCISAVEALTSDLRSSIDQVRLPSLKGWGRSPSNGFFILCVQAWVREHLKERRMYEAASGRMDRLEKSALIIWNKHSVRTAPIHLTQYNIHRTEESNLVVPFLARSTWRWGRRRSTKSGYTCTARTETLR